MIYDDGPWKRALLADAARLLRWRDQARTTEASLRNAERVVMLGFYSIRKLLEAHKLTDKTRSLTLRLKAYQPTGTRVTLLSSHRIDETFHLGTGRATRLDLSFVSNQVIHSYVFMIIGKKRGGISGFFFTSDYGRRKQLLFMTTTEIARCFRHIGKDYRLRVSLTYDKGIQDYRVSSSK